MAARHDLAGLHRVLALHRAAAAKLEHLRDQGQIPARARCGRGFEAVSVGAARALAAATDGTGDVIAPTSRNHGAPFAFGATPLDLFRQYLARDSAPGGGRDPASCHTALARGLVGSVALPGTMVEVMAGITLAFRLRGQDRVGLVFSDAGDTSTSAWHEGINFAAVQRCPLVVLVQTGDGPPAAAHSRVRDLGRKAPGYGIASESVDGSDVLAVRRIVRKAAARARSGGGVSLVEARGCPVAGRVRRGGRRGPPRTRSEEAPGPVAGLRARLIAEGGVRASDLDEVERRARDSVDAACAQALAESSPAGANALGGVYAGDSGSPPWYRLHPPVRRPVPVRAAAT